MATNRAWDDSDRRGAAPPHTELPQVGAAPARQPVQPTVGEPTPMVNGDRIRALRYAREVASDLRWRGMTVPALYTSMAEEFQALVRSGAYTAWVASAEKARASGTSSTSSSTGSWPAPTPRAAASSTS